MRSEACGHPIGVLPIGGNHETFSFEPFMECSLAPGQATDWTMTHDF